MISIFYWLMARFAGHREAEVYLLLCPARDDTPGSKVFIYFVLRSRGGHEERCDQEAKPEAPDASASRHGSGRVRQLKASNA